MQFPKKRSIVFRRNPFIFEAGVLSLTTRAVYRFSGSIWSVFSNTTNIPGRPKPSEKSDLCCVFFTRYSVLSTKLHPVPTADINRSIDMYFWFYYRQELWFPLTRSDTEMNSNFHRSAGGAFSFKYRTDI